MKQVDLAVGMACAVEVSYPRTFVKATVVEKGCRYRKTNRGVRVRYEADGGSGYSAVKAGEFDVVPSARVIHVWTEADDERVATSRADARRVANVEQRLAGLGIITSREHLDAEREADQEARIAARKRGDEDWYSAEAEPVDRPHASVGIGNVTMPLETLEFLLERNG